MDSLLAAYLANRSIENRNAVVEASVYLVKPRAALFATRELQFDDLMQSGTVGLIKAVESFNPGLGPFPQYAIRRIVGYIIDFIREQTSCRRRSRANVGRTEQLTFNVATPDDDFPFDSAEETVSEICKQLPDRSKRIFVMRYAQGITFEQIGKELGISESRVRQVHGESIKYLRKTLTLP